MFFGYGTGANGKGVLLSTVNDIANNGNCKTATADTFTITPAPNGRRWLYGRPPVICPEVDQGRRWAEIKQLTGGDRIS
jgi:putative DNA primase/helicase